MENSATVDVKAVARSFATLPWLVTLWDQPATFVSETDYEIEVSGGRDGVVAERIVDSHEVCPFVVIGRVDVAGKLDPRFRRNTRLKALCPVDGSWR
ncbi:hypothetical protein ACFVWF_30355 [Rhodococcus qingshengii]|uniref:hypothetical protein n=1 Tax=Rhodococcus qingshengii TaxID=334542 RepID=UPI0036DECBAF